MPESVTEFRQLELADTLLSALDSMGFVSPTPIQAASIPLLLTGADALGKAQTGTGKTAAFSLPVLNKVDLSQHKPQAIVMAPTRELAIQVAAEIKVLGQNIKGLKVLEIYGGASIVDQMRALKNGAHIVVGTPGRVKDLISRDRLHLDEVSTFVLDEADEMLKMGFVDDVTWIMEQAPSSAQRVLFSATMPPIVKQIVDRFLRNPERIDVAGENRTVSQVSQQFWIVKGVEKDEAMIRMLETEESIDASIVFVRTRQDTERLADWLSSRGCKAAALHGDIPQSLRERTVDHIKRGVIDVLVATDVVARGLDVQRITHVFNYDIPFDVESYIHRIGRTGRAGRSGKAILLVRTNQIRMLRTIERVTKSRMEEIQLPNRDAVAAARLTRLGQELESQKEQATLEAFVELVGKLQETIDVDAPTLAAMLLQRQQGNRPLFYKGPDPMIAAIDREQQRRERRGNDDRGDRGTRNERGGERGGERRSTSSADWDTYQLQVGREQGIQVKDIVGAIANELGLSKEFIGAIKLAPSHTFVQLPKKMSAEVSAQLKKLRIRQNDVKAVVVEGEVLREHRPRNSGSRDGGRGGYRGNRDSNGGNGGERRFDRNRGSDNRGGNRGSGANSDRPRRPSGERSNNA
ncbi:DEAD/DEAH box helicase [Photobacterium frigidiphilum]|uniref:DEAD/DEAH box helicase n=1 Tax=Photobacterium frigidiphilum TaxID=264736 RepID=UPI003D13BCC8